MPVLQLTVIAILLSTVFVYSQSECSGYSCDTCPLQREPDVIFGLFHNPCRWCFRDQKCHEYGSDANPCKGTENIVSPTQCSKVHYKYDENLAIKLYKIASMTYIKHPVKLATCLYEDLGVSLDRKILKICDSVNSTCFAITAVSKPDKAVIVSFRGTVSDEQLHEELEDSLDNPMVPYPAGGRLKQYFYAAFLTLWPKIQYLLRALLYQYPHYDVWVTGHSLGGALASIASTEIVYSTVAPAFKVKFISFGQPRVGDFEYAATHDRLVPYSFRVVHNRDTVPNLPPCALKEEKCAHVPGAPYHHGIEIWYPQESMENNYRVCLGRPYDEDASCSFHIDIMSLSWNDHLRYFGIGDRYCNNQTATLQMINGLFL